MPYRKDNRLVSLFENLPDAAVLTGVDRSILDVNAAFVRVFGYSRDEARELHPIELYPDPSSYERTRVAVEEAIGPHQSAQIYTHYRRKDGSTFPARATLMRLVDLSGEHVGFAGVFADLSDVASEREGLPEELAATAAERAFLTGLYNRTPALMHSIDSKGIIRTVSAAWLERFGYSEVEVIGRKSTDFLTDESRQRAIDVLLPEFWRTGRCVRVPYTMLTKAGDPVEVELSAVTDSSSGEVRTLALLEDVTERNQALRELEQRDRDLRNFTIQLAAHDLQSPLRHISVLADMIFEDVAEGNTDDLLAHARMIQRSARRGTTFVEGLRRYASIAPDCLDLAPTDLGELIRNACQQHQADIDSRLATLDIGPLPVVRCDPLLLEQAFAQIIGNALKYVAEDVAPCVIVRAVSSGDVVVLTFEDNGIGIPAEFRERIFEPLKRLHGHDSLYKGSGLGLALCRKIVEMHRGEISAVDPEGQGAKFVLRLPIGVMK